MLLLHKRPPQMEQQNQRNGKQGDKKKGKGKQLFDGSQESSNSNRQRTSNKNTRLSGE